MKKYMLNLSFEMTRRCNLNCLWCARGDAQNVNITKEIIDKTLDEIEPFYLHQIEFTGGEPFMNPDMVLYLAQQIVKRHIKVAFIYIPTNGTIKNQKIKEALIILSDYFESTKNQPWRQEIEKFFSEDIILKHNYSKAEGKNILVACSVYEHDNGYTIDDVVDFYNIGRDNCISIKQTDGIGGSGVIIEGRAAEMYRLFPEERLVRMIYNKYCIIRDDFDDSVVITKSLSISANGNVYVGCLQSYENIDKEPLFNIMECTGDFYQRIDKWCWDNPISETSNQYMEMYMVLQWKKKHGFYFSPQTERSFNVAIGRINLLKEIMKKQHKELPRLKHYEINIVSAILACLLSKNFNDRDLFLILSGLDKTILAKSISDSALAGMYRKLRDKNDERRLGMQV